MAIKGKKKSQSRGSQARRRPAAAPRPVVAARRTPWYRTDRGRALALAALVVVLGVAWWAVARAQARAADEQLRRDALETFTGDVQALLQSVRPAAQGMAAAAGAASGERLREAPKGWIETLEAARDEAREIFAGPAVAPVKDLYGQSIGMYLSAAKTYRLAAAMDDATRIEVLARAGEQQEAASGVWLAATGVLDRERAELGLDASGLGLPAHGPAGALPDVPATGDDGDGGGG